MGLLYTMYGFLPLTSTGLVLGVGYAWDTE